MRTKRIIWLLILCLRGSMVFAQEVSKEQVADAHSYELYTMQQWKELLTFGKTTIKHGTDFSLLRMRMGYAALMLGKYSQSLKHYEKTYMVDHRNAFALYYTYLNELYLNNTLAARYYAGKMKEGNRKAEKLKQYKLSSVQLEGSYKMPQSADRGHGTYLRLGADLHLGYRFALQQSVGYFNQTISETSMTGVTNNTKIAIAQKEYYGQLKFAANGKLTISGGFHYVYTPFNNYTYHNTIGFGGVSYNMPSVHLQAMVHSGKIGDSSYHQVDGAVTLYPLGNTNLYTISKAAYGKDFIFSQIAGLKVRKNIWLEGNVTTGQYTIFLDHDDLYLFNDIDTKKFKVGCSAYITFAKKMMLTLNYCFEKKQHYGTTDLFNQHSTTGGLQWNF